VAAVRLQIVFIQHVSRVLAPWVSYHRMLVWRAFSDNVLMDRSFFIFSDVFYLLRFIEITLYRVNLNKFQCVDGDVKATH